MIYHLLIILLQILNIRLWNEVYLWKCILTLNLLKKLFGWLSLYYVVAHVLVLCYGHGLSKKIKEWKWTRDDEKNG